MAVCVGLGWFVFSAASDLVKFESESIDSGFAGQRRGGRRARGGGGGGVGGAPERGVVLFNSQNKRIKEFFFSIVMCGWVMLQNMLGDLIELSVDRISGYCVPRPVQVTRLFGDSG